MVDAARRRWCRGSCRPHHLPVQAGGIALNIIAIAGLLQSLEERHASWRWLLRPASSFLVMESCTLQLVCLCRMLLLCERVGGRWRSTFVRELCSRRVTAAHCALLVGVQASIWSNALAFRQTPLHDASRSYLCQASQVLNVCHVLNVPRAEYAAPAPPPASSTWDWGWGVGVGV